MAGGAGLRLRPLSLSRPKPMTLLLDRPLLEHGIQLLRTHGITDICIATGPWRAPITAHFGSGAAFGVRLTYVAEDAPLGTAGSVKACMGHLGEEDFLALGCDSLCDLDLSAAVGLHRTCRSAATLLLCRGQGRRGRAGVLTDESGYVKALVPAPAPGGVLPTLTDSGIYLLTGEAMSLVPPHTPFDLVGDLFPLLLSRGKGLYGAVVEGYWHGLSTCADYLQCVDDALSGKVALDLPAPKIAPGIWACGGLPSGVALVPPCYLGPRVRLGEGSLIGPHAALGADSVVGRRALVQHSALHAATVGDAATLYGAILTPGATLARFGVLNEGAVLGEGGGV